MIVSRLRTLAPYVSAAVATVSGGYVCYTRYYRVAYASSEAAKPFKEARVLVVGGGYGGIDAALKLKDQCNVTLIDARNAFHHNMGAQRSAVQKGFSRKCLIPYGPTFKDVYKQGLVVDVDPRGKKIQLQSGETLAYDYLIIATGTGGPFPAKLPLNANQEVGISMYDHYQQLVEKAKTVVVVGGGAVGVEIAGDVKEDFKDKKVVLVHPHDNFLVNETVSESFLKTLRGRLDHLGVEMVLGERVMNLDEAKAKNYQDVVLKTDKGRSLKADLAVPCTGLKVNSIAYEKGLGDKVDRLGRLKVGKFLEVEGEPDIFAIGDCNNTPEIKLAKLAGDHSKSVVKNLKLKHEGKEMTPYPVNDGVFMVLSCGRSGGAAQIFGGWVFGDWFARTIKAKNVFVPMQWKNMGQKEPEI